MLKIITKELDFDKEIKQKKELVSELEKLGVSFIKSATGEELLDNSFDLLIKNPETFECMQKDNQKKEFIRYLFEVFRNANVLSLNEIFENEKIIINFKDGPITVLQRPVNSNDTSWMIIEHMFNFPNNVIKDVIDVDFYDLYGNVTHFKINFKVRQIVIVDQQCKINIKCIRNCNNANKKYNPSQGERGYYINYRLF